jgi:putative transposase
MDILFLIYMSIRFERNRTSTFIIMYSLYLYFLGLSLRNTSKALEPFKDERRSYVSVWNWIQRFGSYQLYKRKRISAFIIDETLIQVGNKHFWLWICIEPVHKSVLGIHTYFTTAEYANFVIIFGILT